MDSSQIVSLIETLISNGKKSFSVFLLQRRLISRSGPI